MPTLDCPAVKQATWYLSEFNSMSQEEQASALPFCIAENLTMEEFHSECDQLESCRWEFKDGNAWIYELPVDAHDSAAGEAIKQLILALGNAHAGAMRVMACPRCDNNSASGNWSYERDGSLTVRGYRPGQGHADAKDSYGNRWPNVIVEVAFQESEPHVLAKAREWLETATNPNHGVQQVIVIKIGTTLRADGHRTMKAWRYQRDAHTNPVQVVEFGNHGPNQGATEVGRTGMQLDIPVASLYLPLDPPTDLPGPLVLDLFYIRRAVEESFEEQH